MNEQNNKKQPDFIAYNVNKAKDGKAYWDNIGTAYQHPDGKGLDIRLHSIPVDGHVTLREQRNERLQGYENQRQTAQSQQVQPTQTQNQTMSQNRGQSR